MGKTIDRLKNIRKERSDTKICPICGYEAKVKSNTYDPWGDGGGTITEYWCECSGCGIIKAGAFSTYNDDCDTAQRKAKEDWNSVIDYLN
jgi:hypothetical protein